MLGRETGAPFEFCHIFINALLRIVWKYFLKWFIQVIDDSNLIVFIYFVLFYFYETTWYLVLPKIFWMSKLPTKWLLSKNYAWQLIYSHEVMDTNDNFKFLGIFEKLPPVLLRIQVTLLNKYLNQNIKINKLFINIESFSTLLKLVGNSALKKTILSRMWKNLAFPCDRNTLFWLFLFLFISSSLECVFPLSTKWTFTSNVKALALSRLSVSLISSGAMIFASKSLINLSILSSLLLF